MDGLLIFVQPKRLQILLHQKLNRLCRPWSPLSSKQKIILPGRLALARLPHNELSKVSFQCIRYLHGSGFCTFAVTDKKGAFSITGFQVSTTDVCGFRHTNAGGGDKVNCHPLSHCRNLTAFDIEGGLVPNGAPEEFYLLVTVILDAVDVLDLPGSLGVQLFPRAWKLDDPAGISIHNCPFRFSIEFRIH